MTDSSAIQQVNDPATHVPRLRLFCAFLAFVLLGCNDGAAGRAHSEYARVLPD